MSVTKEGLTIDNTKRPYKALNNMILFKYLKG